MMTMFPLLGPSVIVLTTLTCFTKSQVSGFPCESKCPVTDESTLNIHLIPHSHMDVSWVKTFEQYYWGTGNPKDNVQAVFDSVIDAVDDDPSRRFIFVETAFIWMWLKHHNEKMRAKFIKLVNTGQIEIVSGGWSMNDEACTNYQAIIDQMTLGHSELKRMLGECAAPKVAWQIDPFGHSREFAHLATQMKLNALFLHRVHFEDSQAREESRRMHLKWQTSDDLPSEMLTVLLPAENGYDAPVGLKFSDLENDPLVTDKQSPEYNSLDVIEGAVDSILSLVNTYNQSNILVPIGGDFAFKHAHEMFAFYDGIIKEINSVNESDIRVFYSTPSCYLNNLKRESKLKLVSKTGDFYPYLSSPEDIWTGYFTSRQSTKIAVRIANNLLQSCKQLQALANIRSPEDDENVAALARVVALMQHHDAITGTSKEAVDADYHTKLEQAVTGCSKIAQAAINKLVEPASQMNVSVCHRLNESLCDASIRADSFSLVIHNSLGWPVNDHLVKLPWTEDPLVLVDTHGHEMAHQVVPIFNAFLSGEMKNTSVQSHLEFMVPLLPPTSMIVLHVRRSASDQRSPRVEEISPGDDFVILSQSQQVHFNKVGQLTKVVLKDGTVVRLTQQFALYRGSNEKAGQSDAYLFYPSKPARMVNHTQAATVIQSNHYTEVRQLINERISQCIRVSRYDDLIEFEYRVTSSQDKEAEEIITRYLSDLKSKSTFFTDANGRQLMKRTRNLYQNRSPMTQDVHKVSSNYYPVTSRIILKDEQRDLQMTVFTDRSQGGSSLQDGQIELMIHSMSSQADHLGMGEALGDTDEEGRKNFLRGKHKLLIASIADSTVHREIAVKLHQSPVYYFVEPEQPVQQGYLAINLPANVRLLSFEVAGNESTLIRLEHIYQKQDAVDKSAAVTVDLSDVFSAIGAIKSLREVSLTGQELKSSETVSENDSRVVTLEAMMIKSFIVRFAPYMKK